MDYPSPNFEDRPQGVTPSFIILHYTGMKTGAEALARLVDPNPGTRVSAHYLVEEDGRIFRLVDEDKTAWHAGKSYWAGQQNLNPHSIGIEIVNPGHEWGYRPFPVVQMESVAELCRDIIGRNRIPASNILGHSDVAPSRKQDPGELFDWKFLAERGVGLWPEDVVGESADVDEEELRAMLTKLGYDPSCDLLSVITAFQRHFYPEAFSVLGSGKNMTPQSVSRLRALVKAVAQDLPSS